MKSLDWYVHGLWVLGTVFLFLGALMAGNIEWVEGTNALSFGAGVVIAFLLLLIGGMFWISAAINARENHRKWV